MDADSRREARVWSWLDARHAEIVAELVADMPVELRNDHRVTQCVAEDAADEAIRELRKRFIADPTFERSFYLDT